MWKSVTQRWVLCQFFWVIIYLMPTTLQNLYWMRMFISRGWRSHYVKNKWRTRDRKTILSKSQRPPSDLQGPAWSICFWHSFFTILHFAYSASVTQSSLLFFEQTRRVPTGFLLFFFRKCSSPKYTNGYLLSLSLCPNVTCSMMPALTCCLKLHLCLPQHPLFCFFIP